MKKINALLILATFAMAACDSANNENVPSIASSSENIASSSEVISSSNEAISSSGEAPISSSVLPSSSEVTFDPTAKTAVTFSPADLPAQNQGKYLTNTEITVGGVNFKVNDIQKNDGKYNPISTIQMKKVDEDDGTASSYIENLSPIHAKLKITLIANIIDYYDYDEETYETIHVYKDTSVCPTVYAGMTSENVTTKLTGVESGAHENKKAYTVSFDDAANYQYFKIVNEANNAQYVQTFVWANE